MIMHTPFSLTLLSHPYPRPDETHVIMYIAYRAFSQIVTTANTLAGLDASRER